MAFKNFKKEILKEKKEVEVEPVLPNRNPYNKDLFYRIHVPDLLADLLLLFFSIFISHELFSDGGVFMHLQTWHILAMYIVVALTIPWYLAYLYVRNTAYYKKGIMKIILWLFIIMVFMILVNLLRLVFQTGPNNEGLITSASSFTQVFAIFMLVLGPMMCLGGGIAAQDEFKPDKNPSDKFDPDKIVTTGALIIIVLSIAFMLGFIGIFPEGSSNWVIFGAFIIGPFAAVIVYGLFIYFLIFLDKIGLYKYFKLIAQSCFPFFIISILVFWSGVAIYFMQHDFLNDWGKITRGGMLFTICVSGLVPFRLFMMFNAPIRFVNLIIGSLSLGYFIIRMMMLTF